MTSIAPVTINSPESAVIRRLPSRKRSRSAAVADIDTDHDGRGQTPNEDAGIGSDDAGGEGPGTPTPTPLLVMPDLIHELIENGSVAPHIKRLLRATHGVTWRDRTGIEPEVEVGTNVLDNLNCPFC